MLLEPSGFEIENYRFGASMALLANVNRDPKDIPDAFTPQDFMYDYKRLLEPEHGVQPEKRMSNDEMIKAKAQFWTQARGN